MSYDWKSVPLPDRMKHLPRDSVGRVIPWFVTRDDDGVPDFRVVRRGGIEDAMRWELCWVCGTRRGRHAAFLLGPMCGINRVSAEPPSHLECATYAAKACPFMANPQMRRRPVELGVDGVEPAGEMLLRNPGVGLVWSSKTWVAFGAPHSDGSWGVLFDVGEPTAASWWAHGREATAEEVGTSLSSGLPTLREAARHDGPKAVADLARRVVIAMTLVPRDTVIDPRPYEGAQS